MIWGFWIWAQLHTRDLPVCLAYNIQDKIKRETYELILKDKFCQPLFKTRFWLHNFGVSIYHIKEQCVAMPYRILGIVIGMMIRSKELFEEIWVSRNYETVFCTVEEKEQYMSFLSSKKDIPRGMSIVLINKKLARPYTRNEIMNAAPEQLRQMTK
jgi:hypothetical protein